MKKSIAISLSVVAVALLVGAIFFSDFFRPIRHSPPITSAISDARQLAMLCLLFQEENPGDESLAQISLENALSLTDEAFRQQIYRRLEEGTILFFPPSVPVDENPIVAVVIWEDVLVTISGSVSAHAYDKRTSSRTNRRMQ